MDLCFQPPVTTQSYRLNGHLPGRRRNNAELAAAIQPQKVTHKPTRARATTQLLIPESVSRDYLERDPHQWRRLGVVVNPEQGSRPKLYRISSSTQYLFGGELGHVLADLKLSNTWFAFMPSMLGSSSATDAAANAVIKAHYLSHSSVSSDLARCDHSYLAAINSLRNSLDVSDSALATVGLLVLYEAIRKDEPKALFSHAGGIGAILKARPKSTPTTPLMRAVLYGTTYATFQQPLNHGTVSDFDDPYWLEMEPAIVGSANAETSALRKLSNQLLIRIPGLIVRVRQLRETGDSTCQLFAITTELASELLSLKNDVDESTMLHRIAMKPTKNSYDRTIMPYSFALRSSYDTETLLLYWCMRLIILKLCLTLNDLNQSTSPTSSAESSTGSSSTITSFDTSAIQSEEERLVMSILMCWQDGLGQANPMSMVWGTLMNRTTFRGKPIAPFRAWVRLRYHDALAGWPVQYTEADMDEDAEVMAGGPLTGWVVKQFAEEEKSRTKAQKLRDRQRSAGDRRWIEDDQS